MKYDFYSHVQMLTNTQAWLRALHTHTDKFTNGLCSVNKVQILTTLHTKLSSILASKVNDRSLASPLPSQRPTVVIT